MILTIISLVCLLLVIGAIIYLVIMYLDLQKRLDSMYKIVNVDFAIPDPLRPIIPKVPPAPPSPGPSPSPGPAPASPAPGPSQPTAYCCQNIDTNNVTKDCTRTCDAYGKLKCEGLVPASCKANVSSCTWSDVSGCQSKPNAPNYMKTVDMSLCNATNDLVSNGCSK
jgi:hypothetical protein